MPPYTAVPNCILEAQHLMNESEFRVTMALIRLTHGYHKAECKASYDTLEEMTGLSRGGVASGVAAAGARGFFERFGRSGWKSLVYSVDQNSLPVRLNDQPDSLPVRLEKSTEYTENSLLSRPSSYYIKKDKKSSKENGVVDSRFSEVVTCYENNIAQITPLMADNLKDAVDTYPVNWIVEAVGIAVANNVRKWRYIHGILNNWQTKGRGDVGGNGHMPGQSFDDILNSALDGV